MSRTNRIAGHRQRRLFLGMDIAIGAGFVAAMIALAQEAKADTEFDPFEDLFGTAGINTWTPAADSYLATIDPTNALAANLDTSVDNFVTAAAPPYFYGPDTSFSEIATSLDPGAFPGALISGNAEFLTPLDANADFALGLDYTLFATGLAPVVDPLITDLEVASQLPLDFLQLLVILGLPLGL
jgi:hypothetical protein